MALLLDGTTGISATGNITGGNVIASGTLTAGSFAPGSVSTAGNVTGAYIIGNGSALTGLPAGYSNSNLATLGSNVISTTGTITGGNITGSNILTGGLISVTGTVTAASVVGGVITGSSVSVTGTQTAASTVGGVITGTSLSVSGSVTAGGNLSLVGNIVDTGPLTVITSSDGNITLAPNGTGVVIVNTDIRNGQVSGTGNIGATGAVFNTIFAKATSAQYADLAEVYIADTAYAPGTVIEFGGNNEITATTTTHSVQVAGIISTNPAYLMNSTQAGEHAVEVALVGRVPCSVVGTVRKGDRLVSSDRPGVAQALNTNLYQPGCIIGKALEAYDSETVGTIEVAVGRT